VRASEAEERGGRVGSGGNEFGGGVSGEEVCGRGGDRCGAAPALALAMVIVGEVM